MGTDIYLHAEALVDGAWQIMPARKYPWRDCPVAEWRDIDPDCRSYTTYALLGGAASLSERPALVPPEMDAEDREGCPEAARRARVLRENGPGEAWESEPLGWGAWWGDWGFRCVLLSDLLSIDWDAPARNHTDTDDVVPARDLDFVRWLLGPLALQANECGGVEFVRVCWSYGN